MRSLELPGGGWTFPLKVAYDLANHTYEGRKECLQYTQPTAFEYLADESDEPRNQRTSLSDYWVKMGKLWMRVHSTLRTRTFSPVGVDNGPDPSTLKHVRTTQMIFEDGTMHIVNDDWTAAQTVPFPGRLWTGTTIFYPEGVPDSGGITTVEPLA